MSLSGNDHHKTTLSPLLNFYLMSLCAFPLELLIIEIK